MEQKSKKVSKKPRHPFDSGKVLDFKEASDMDIKDMLKFFQVKEKGLTDKEARRRSAKLGKNEVMAEKKKTWFIRLIGNLRDPLSGLLLILGIISYFTGEIKSTILIIAILVLSVILRYVQEARADTAAEKLKAMVHTTATVLRDGAEKEIPLKHLVIGDVIRLNAGDMVPADVRLIQSKDLYTNEAFLTGESFPVEKHAQPLEGAKDTDTQKICFMGTNIQSGTATGVIYASGANTRFGAMSKEISTERVLTSFDKGINHFTWMMLRFIAVMVPLVFLINGIGKGDWLEAFLFALAVAVGLTPELLPMIMTVNLSKGAYDMSKHKVIVKRLNSIQNFGAMDILCTDKTGTLTEGRVVLIKHLDIEGNSNEKILDFAYLNSFYQTGLKNLLDEAVLRHDTEETRRLSKSYKKVDEIPFDFVRRRMSVVIEDLNGSHLLICKGAVEEVLSKCGHVQESGKITEIAKYHHENKDKLITDLNSEGFRVVALAYKHMPLSKKIYSPSDEEGMTLMGFLAFLDPPKATAGKAIAELQRYGIAVKILTGDNELVTRKICSEIGLPVNRILKGDEVEKMTDEQLKKAVEETTILNKLEPRHKERVIKAIQSLGHVVGYLGDGINDASALKAADVGISVNGAVDIAKESSDIILLEKNLLVLCDGVREGRHVFGNILKYIKMTASSNFGNMFSVLGASLFLPFLPMLPIQVIANNLLYDFSEITIPTDIVDDEYITKPRSWDIGKIEKYIFYFGPISSLFDFVTFFAMIWLFHAWVNPELFHTGWFVESLVSQTLIIHIIRTNKIPFIQSRPSLALTISTLVVAGLAVYLPFSPLASLLGFVPLPPLYWLVLTAIIVSYLLLTQIMKRWFVQRFEWE
jgi:Mg2+-importing ATPase